MIFLSVLKIIGIVLACLVGFVLLFVLLVLFAPVQYKIHGEGENADTVITGSAKWIFGFATLKAAYVNYTFGYKIKAAGIKIRMGKFPEEKSKKADNFVHSKIYTDAKIVQTEENTFHPEQDDIPKIDYVHINDPKRDALNDSKKEQDEKIKERKKENSFWDKVNIWKDKYEKAKNVLESKVTKKAIKQIKIQVFNLLNHIKPKKIVGKLNFGLEDPSNTAIIYGLIGAVIEMASNNKLVVTPEFYQKGVSLDISISGSIFIGYVVLCFIRLLLDRNVKSLFRTVRRIV